MYRLPSPLHPLCQPQWQSAFSKNGCNDVFHHTCSFYRSVFSLLERGQASMTDSTNKNVAKVRLHEVSVIEGSGAGSGPLQPSLWGPGHHAVKEPKQSWSGQVCHQETYVERNQGPQPSAQLSPPLTVSNHSPATCVSHRRGGHPRPQ